MELVEITRIAINETDQAKIRGAVDIKVPFVVCPEAIVESQLAPARLIGKATSPVATLYDSSQARGLGCGDKLRSVSWIVLWPLQHPTTAPRGFCRRPVIEVHEILESIEPASVTPV